jgi:hypothetical protein
LAAVGVMNCGGMRFYGDAWPLAQAQSRIWAISSREALERPVLALPVRRLLGRGRR